MTQTDKSTMDRMGMARARADDHWLHGAAAKTGRFVLSFLEMLAAMMVGMPILFSLRSRVPASSFFAAAFVRGTNLNDLAMLVFMVVPMVIWMTVRGHDWRHSAEMVFAMSLPVVAAIALRLMGVGDSQGWLIGLSRMGMVLGMLAEMLYRRDHYLGTAPHGAQAEHAPH